MAVEDFISEDRIEGHTEEDLMMGKIVTGVTHTETSCLTAISTECRGIGLKSVMHSSANRTDTEVET